jgi:hypothetical protein
VIPVKVEATDDCPLTVAATLHVKAPSVLPTLPLTVAVALAVSVSDPIVTPFAVDVNPVPLLVEFTSIGDPSKLPETAITKA